MGNETHIKWLLEGQDAWNARRASQDFYPDFWFTDLYERFRRAGKLDRNGIARLNRFDLDDAIFMGGNLTRVDFG